jgi:hypothetical protein
LKALDPDVKTVFDVEGHDGVACAKADPEATNVAPPSSQAAACAARILFLMATAPSCARGLSTEAHASGTYGPRPPTQVNRARHLHVHSDRERRRDGSSSCVFRHTSAMKAR